MSELEKKIQDQKQLEEYLEAKNEELLQRFLASQNLQDNFCLYNRETIKANFMKQLYEMESKRLAKEEGKKVPSAGAGNDSESTTRRKINSQLKHFERSLTYVDRQAILKTKQFILGNKNTQTIKTKPSNEDFLNPSVFIQSLRSNQTPDMPEKKDIQQQTSSYRGNSMFSERKNTFALDHYHQKMGKKKQEKSTKANNQKQLEQNQRGPQIGDRFQNETARSWFSQSGQYSQLDTNRSHSGQLVVPQHSKLLSQQEVSRSKDQIQQLKQRALAYNQQYLLRMKNIERKGNKKPSQPKKPLESIQPGPKGVTQTIHFSPPGPKASAQDDQTKLRTQSSLSRTHPHGRGMESKLAQANQEDPSTSPMKFNGGISSGNKQATLANSGETRAQGTQVQAATPSKEPSSRSRKREVIISQMSVHSRNEDKNRSSSTQAQPTGVLLGQSSLTVNKGPTPNRGRHVYVTRKIQIGSDVGAHNLPFNNTSGSVNTIQFSQRSQQALKNEGGVATAMIKESPLNKSALRRSHGLNQSPVNNLDSRDLFSKILGSPWNAQQRSENPLFNNNSDLERYSQSFKNNLKAMDKLKKVKNAMLVKSDQANSPFQSSSINKGMILEILVNASTPKSKKKMKTKSKQPQKLMIEGEKANTIQLPNGFSPRQLEAVAAAAAAGKKEYQAVCFIPNDGQQTAKGASQSKPSMEAAEKTKATNDFQKLTVTQLLKSSLDVNSIKSQQYSPKSYNRVMKEIRSARSPPRLTNGSPEINQINSTSLQSKGLEQNSSTVIMQDNIVNIMMSNQDSSSVERRAEGSLSGQKLTPPPPVGFSANYGNASMNTKKEQGTGFRPPVGKIPAQTTKHGMPAPMIQAFRQVQLDVGSSKQKKKKKGIDFGEFSLGNTNSAEKSRINSHRGTGTSRGSEAPAKRAKRKAQKSHFEATAYPTRNKQGAMNITEIQEHLLSDEHADNTLGPLQASADQTVYLNQSVRPSLTHQQIMVAAAALPYTKANQTGSSLPDDEGAPPQSSSRDPKISPRSGTNSGLAQVKQNLFSLKLDLSKKQTSSFKQGGGPKGTSQVRPSNKNRMQKNIDLIQADIIGGMINKKKKSTSQGPLGQQILQITGGANLKKRAAEAQARNSKLTTQPEKTERIVQHFVLENPIDSYRSRHGGSQTRNERGESGNVQKFEAIKLKEASMDLSKEEKTSLKSNMYTNIKHSRYQGRLRDAKNSSITHLQDRVSQHKSSICRQSQNKSKKSNYAQESSLRRKGTPEGNQQNDNIGSLSSARGIKDTQIFSNRESIHGGVESFNTTGIKRHYFEKKIGSPKIKKQYIGSQQEKRREGTKIVAHGRKQSVREQEQTIEFVTMSDNLDRFQMGQDEHGPQVIQNQEESRQENTVIRKPDTSFKSSTYEKDPTQRNHEGYFVTPKPDFSQDNNPKSFNSRKESQFSTNSAFIQDNILKCSLGRQDKSKESKSSLKNNPELKLNTGGVPTDQLHSSEEKPEKPPILANEIINEQMQKHKLQMEEAKANKKSSASIRSQSHKRESQPENKAQQEGDYQISEFQANSQNKEEDSNMIPSATQHRGSSTTEKPQETGLTTDAQLRESKPSEKRSTQKSYRSYGKKSPGLARKSPSGVSPLQKTSSKRIPVPAQTSLMKSMEQAEGRSLQYSLDDNSSPGRMISILVANNNNNNASGQQSLDGQENTQQLPNLDEIPDIPSSSGLYDSIEAIRDTNKNSTPEEPQDGDYVEANLAPEFRLEECQFGEEPFEKGHHSLERGATPINYGSMTSSENPIHNLGKKATNLQARRRVTVDSVQFISPLIREKHSSIVNSPFPVGNQLVQSVIMSRKGSNNASLMNADVDNSKSVLGAAYKTASQFSGIKELQRQRKERVNREVFKVSSKALRLGQTVYTEKNAYRSFKKMTKQQVNEVLEDYYQSKKNGKSKKYNKWTNKQITQLEHQLNFDTNLSNIIDPHTGSPLQGRSKKLIEHIKKNLSPGKGHEKDYSLNNWGEPSRRSSSLPKSPQSKGSKQSPIVAIGSSQPKMNDVSSFEISRIQSQK